MNKSELRARLRTQYKAMGVQARQKADAAIARQLYAHPLFQACDCVFFYVGVGTEIHTMPMIEKAVQSGKTVALPKSDADGVMTFYRYTGALREGKYHIPEPDGIEMMIPGQDDLMIVPGLAFDSCGARLGQGGGYYDRYLAQHPCCTVGLCRETFFLEEIPALWNDLPVDCVITENGEVFSIIKNGAS